MVNDLIATWRWVAGFVIFPVTVFPGFRALILVFSSFCVLLDSWSLEGAMTNLSLGFPAVVGITALWISTLLPLATVARTRTGFVLVTTGLMMGLILECLILKAGLWDDLGRLRPVDPFHVFVFICPLIMGVINLLLLIRARELLTRPPVRVEVEESRPVRRHRRIPRHHLQPPPVLRPVILRPYQPPVSSWYDDEPSYD
ncbi:MAG: hypothetical protein ACP5XB_00585 [Isosphaeraceae bacterium]